MKTVSVHPLDLVTGTFEDATALIKELADRSQAGTSIIVHINARNYHFLLKEPDLIREIRDRAIPLLDGIGIKAAVWLSGKGMVPDLNGTDLFPLVMEAGSHSNLRIYLLGASEDVVEEAARKITETYSGIDVCGYHHGYFQESEEEQLVQSINQQKPQILMLGMGFPKQEHFSLQWNDALNANLIWNVGGLFEFIAGKNPRAPAIVRYLRLEWLFRWMVEPVRLFKRTFIYEPYSVFRIIWFEFHLKKD